MEKNITEKININTEKTCTEKITLWGIVQGVGFRPFVAKIADRLSLSGNVRNTGGLVEITVMARKSEIDCFVQMILDEKPKPAEIVHIKREVLRQETLAYEREEPVVADGNKESIASYNGEAPVASDSIERSAKTDSIKKSIATDERKESFPTDGRESSLATDESKKSASSGFVILSSSEGDEEAAMIPADLAVCDDCLAEMCDPQNSRYNHPMISCMVCGPRYTITDVFPYDRENTSMNDFEMCSSCHREYTDVKDRRYHAQTISCHDCGPFLKCRARLSALGECIDGKCIAEECIAEECIIAENIGEKHIASENHAAENRHEKNCDNENFEGKSCHAESSYIKNCHIESCQEETCVSTEKWLDYTTRTDGSEITTLAAKLLKKGDVIAFKSMGGYNLIADPFNDDACEKLRKIKKREAKPFAVMFESAEQIQEYCRMNEVEKKLITSSARPIILLERIRGGSREIERSRFIGSFLPSMGAQYLILEKFGGPLIVTSANAASMPMICEDDAIMSLAEREELISAVIYNDRKIRIRMDDSVARVIDGQPQMIRRSKGYAPVPLYVNFHSGKSKADSENNKLQIFAAGGQLKNSFALSKDEFVYVSQYFGDMDSEESQHIYAENVDRMARMFRIHPQLAVCDMHPLYFSTSFCEEYAAKQGIELLKVQHHHAHVASVMAENNLHGPVIGVSFDGTGYGTDGAVWGGEFLLCNGADFERKAHLKYIEMPGGDESMKDASKAAVCYKYAQEHGYRAEIDETCDDKESANKECEYKDCADKKYNDKKCDAKKCDDKNCNDRECDETGCREIAVYLDEIIAYSERNGIKLKSDGEKKLIEAAISNRINTIRSSSMGRLFDAVAALLGICSYNSYEGECAILLEDAAARAKNGVGSEADSLALKFHMQIRDIILENCMAIRKTDGTNDVALTGGVFQNKILTESTLAVLRENSFNVYYNVSVSPNDGGIALGQMYIAMNSVCKS